MRFIGENFVFILLGAIALIFLVWIAYLQIQLSETKKRLDSFCIGKSGKNLEELIVCCSKGVEDLEAKNRELLKKVIENNGVALNGIQHVGVIRFNPFRDIGGDQSFSIALLNAHKDGIVISSLYTESGVRIYAKSVKNGTSKHQLSEEEQQAIQQSESQKSIKSKVRRNDDERTL